MSSVDPVEFDRLIRKLRGCMPADGDAPELLNEMADLLGVDWELIDLRAKLRDLDWLIWHAIRKYREWTERAK